MATSKEAKAVLCLAILSSSSSSSEDEEFVALLKERVKLPKIKNFVDEVLNKLSDDQFQKYFRLQRTTVQLLINKFQNSKYFPKNDGHGGRVPIPAEVHTYAFLWFAGNKCTTKDVGQRFNITESSFHRVMDRFMGFLLELGPDIIKMPKSALELEQIEKEFRKVAGFPGVVGCIDGTSITIRTPAHKIKSTYVNRHDIPSLTLQGICDYKRRFIDVFTGIPGDGAYFIRPWLLTPYKDYGKLTPDQVNYNKKFCATRVLIENTFGILKSRFRQLTRLDMKSVVTATKFIISCCILHNFCINVDYVIIDDIEYEERFQEGARGETEWQQRKKGEDKRNNIKMSLI
ncbi:putative nuclease HARBI1 [Photinus pyralis]|uniref:putative nuclease HARBI1 n=1 Tax=Photinus pyralis TaxID=7054 RepID=UPI001266EF05|nr:putative nuclease HARBI1 [Photinus pyralis]